jgi:N-acetylglucosamine kinase-like BadF-type ATPase
MPLILGVDLGGTKTHVIAADHLGNILGFGDDKDWDYVDTDRRMRKILRIRHTVAKVVNAAGLELTDFERVSASCSGADWAFEYPIGVRQLRESLGIEMISYYNDCIGALRGGTEMLGRDCAVICLGTGGNCSVFNREGQDFQYAYYFKDQHQGGGAIGRFIADTVVDASVGLAPETALTGLLLQATGCATAEEFHMMRTTGRTEYEAPTPPVYKNFAPLLFEAIRMGDAVATAYLELFSKELAHYVVVGARKLGMEKRDITVVMSGGVCKSDSLMTETIEKYLRHELPGAHCIDALFEPVVGALLLEYDKLYPEGVPPAVMATLERGCAERELFRKVAITRIA